MYIKLAVKPAMENIDVIQNDKRGELNMDMNLDQMHPLDPTNASGRFTAKTQAQRNTLSGFNGKNAMYTRQKYPKEFTIKSGSDLLASNLLFSVKDADWYGKCNRYGWIDVYDHDRVTKEFLFFTRPDLNIFDGKTHNSALSDGIANIPFLNELYHRKPQILGQLQSSVKDTKGHMNPFMYLLSNSVVSKLDMPGISADSQESTSNIMGTTIQYRGSSYKSDNGYDFSLSFRDTAYLEVYSLVKAYDEYMRHLKLGYIAPKRTYIKAHIIPEQFSIYKFLVGSDGETILYYAKFTGCYFTDVPRSDMSDPSDDGIKFSVGFHAQFVEDMNPNILKEFALVANCDGYIKNGSTFIPVHGGVNIDVNNSWGTRPTVIKRTTDSSIYGKRIRRRGVNYDYYLKWVK